MHSFEHSTMDARIHSRSPLTDTSFAHPSRLLPHALPSSLPAPLSLPILCKPGRQVRLAVYIIQHRQRSARMQFLHNSLVCLIPRRHQPEAEVDETGRRRRREEKRTYREEPIIRFPMCPRHEHALHLRPNFRVLLLLLLHLLRARISLSSSLENLINPSVPAVTFPLPFLSCFFPSSHSFFLHSATDAPACFVIRSRVA